MSDFSAVDKRFGSAVFSEPLIFRIPRYQRPYEWEKDDFEQFWNDLKDSSEPFFFGSFIFNTEYEKSEKCLEVVDGQQRLITISIFVAVIRDLAKEVDSTLADRIHSKYILLDDLSLRNKKFKISYSDTLDEFIKNHVLNDKKREEFPLSLTGEKKLVKIAHDFFKERLLEELKNIHTNTEKIEYIQEILERINGLKIINIRIGSDIEAYDIFEAVNAKGVDLSVADLLKNLIFKNIPKGEKGIDQAKIQWGALEESIKETGVEMSKFIRHHWLSKYSFVGEKSLYKEIKRQVTNWPEFLKELHMSAERYNLMLEGGKEDWLEFPNGREIFKTLQGVKAMRVSQCYTLFLCLLRNQKSISFRLDTYFSAIEKFTFIYSSLGKGQANKVEKLYSATAIEIESEIREETKHKDKNIARSLDRLISKLRELQIDDKDFTERFVRISLKKSEHARLFLKYILSKINDFYYPSEFDIDFANATIEHILPQKPNSEWKLSKMEIGNYVNSLGNLTLLAKPLNNSAQNSMLKIKVPMYKKSDLGMTRDLADNIEKESFKWDEGTIEKRALFLAKRALDVWRY